MKTLKLALVAAASAAVMVPAQAEGISYSVGVFTSNTDVAEAKDFKPSLSLGADYDFGNGFYAGAAYNTGKYYEQSKSRGEITLSLGYGNELSNGVFYDINATRYMYPKDGASNANELGLTVGYGPVAVTYYKGFDADGFVSKTDYIDLGYTYSLNDKLSTTLTVTKYRSDDEAKSWSSSLDYELAASYDLGNNLSLTGAINKVKPKLVVGLVKTF